MRGTCHCGMWNLCRVHICFVITLAGTKHVDFLGSYINIGGCLQEAGGQKRHHPYNCQSAPQTVTARHLKPPSPSTLPRPSKRSTTTLSQSPPFHPPPSEFPLQPSPKTSLFPTLNTLNTLNPFNPLNRPRHRSDPHLPNPYPPSTNPPSRQKLAVSPPSPPPIHPTQPERNKLT